MRTLCHPCTHMRTVWGGGGRVLFTNPTSIPSGFLVVFEKPYRSSFTIPIMNALGTPARCTRCAHLPTRTTRLHSPTTTSPTRPPALQPRCGR